MDQFKLNNHLYLNNNNILSEIVKSLENIIKDINNHNIINRIKDIILKMNNLISDNKKNTKSIRDDIQALNNNINKQFEDLKNKNISINNIQTKIYDDGKYEGEFKNNKREGKGIFYYNNDDRYEGDYKNDKFDGKGVYYYNNGDKYNGDWRNGKREGKGIFYYNNGDRYEGNWRNDKFDGKGVYYNNNGDRYEGNWKNGKREEEEYIIIIMVIEKWVII